MGYLSRIARLFKRDGEKPTAAGEIEPAEVVAAENASGVTADSSLADAKRALAEKDYAAAAALFAAAIELRHDDAEAYCGLGFCHLKQQRDEDAADCYEMAAHFQPDLAEPYYRLALLAERRGDYAGAIGHVERALQLGPDAADAHNLLGACLLAVGNATRAAESFARAVELKPESAQFRSNLGYVLLRDLDNFEAGAAHIVAALEIDRGDPAIWCNYCSVLSQQGRLAEAVKICDQLLAANPELHEARLNRALAMLKQGKFGDAWLDYEARTRARSNYLPRPFAYRNWNGESLAGKTVLVYGEQGLGDEIMFASCLPEILQLAGRCIVDCSPRLERLFARSFPAAVVHGSVQTDKDISWLHALGAIDFQIAAGSLPGFFRKRREDFPALGGYLRADPQRVEHWKARLNAAGGVLKVGIAWRGGMRSTRQSMRSLELQELLPLLRLPGVRFVSLQHDATGDEVASFATTNHVALDHWPEVVADIDETAALIAALDLVITVCSAPVHLTGALGCRAWVMVPAAAEWRYLESGESMPWYPGVRMFRQQQAGDWRPVIQAISEAVGREVAASRPAPVMRDGGRGQSPDYEADDQQAAAHFAAGRFAEAWPLYEQMRRRDPGDAEVLFRLGVIYGSTGLLGEATEVLDLAARAQPHSLDVLNAQANVAWLQSDWPRARQLFNAAVELAPQNATLLANFGLCLHDAGQFDAASGILQRAIALEPAHVDALVNAALVHLDMGNTTGARGLLERALAAAPEYPEAHALYAQLLLRQGQYAEGWREYEYRFSCSGARYREELRLPRWNGVPEPSRRLLIYAEQGLGDQIMFASCLPDVLARVAACEAECDARLVKLFARSFPAVQFHAQAPDLQRPWAATTPDRASQIHIGSLPQLFRNQRDQFPIHDGYLKPDPARQAYWSAQLAALGDGLKVGIAWRGGVPRTRQALRSIPLPDWLPLLRLPGVQFVSLQHGRCDDDYREIAAESNVRVTHWQAAIDDCDETAALISALDVVISVCGTVIHLAGAVGKATWVLVPACPEWRYASDGDTMPWYPSVRLYRQTVPVDWRAPFAAIAQELSTTAGYGCRNEDI